MFEWTLVGVNCATAILMIAHTMDEAVSSARPLRTQSHRCPANPVREWELGSRVHRGNDDATQKRAA